MEESIRNKESPPISRQNVTYRRARIADAMYEDSKKMRDIQSALRGIADEIDLGTFPENLKKIKSKKDIEQILNASHSLDNQRINRDTQSQKPLTEKLSVWFRKLEPRFIYENETDHITVSSSNKIYSHNLTWAYKNGLISKTELKEASKLQKTIGSSEAEFIESSNLEEVESLKRLMDKFNKIEQCLYARPAKSNTKNPVIIKDKLYELYFKGNPYSNYAERSLAVLRLGLNTFEQVHEAGQYLRTLIAKNKSDGPDPKKIEIRNMERKLIGSKIPGFFPTPKPLAQRLILEADIQPGMDILEPSAGKGDLAEVISEETGIHPDTIEPVFSLKNILQAKGYTIVADDFLDFVDRRYDRILMNPPFEKGLDIRHVQHAYALLKPGGKLVAIMSEGPFFRGDIRSQDFREWLTEKGGLSEKLPEGSFTGKDSFRQTGVSTRLVTLTKNTDDTLYHKNMSGGISRTFVDNYQPGLNVSNRGVASNSNDWTLKFPTDGDKLEDWPVRFKTKTEAIDQGIRSKRLFQKYFSEPEDYGKKVKPADPNVRSEAMKGNQNAVGEHIAEVGIQGILDKRNAIPPQSNTSIIKETVKSVKRKSFNSVSEILDDKEKNKQFKDSNTRVVGSKKERAALSKLLSYSDISNMDFVTAERVVKKDQIIAPFNARESKEKGESAGLTYLKAKLYEAIASKPADSPFAREQYVKNLEKIMAPILNAKTINEIQSYALNFVEISPYELRNKFEAVMNSLKSKLNGITENEKDAFREEYQKLFAEIIPGSEVLVDKVLNGTLNNSYDFHKEIKVFLKKPSYRFDNDPNLIVHSTVFGDKLINLLRRRTDPGKNTWNDAMLFEPLGELEAKAQYEKYRINFLREDKEYIERVKKEYPTFEDYFRKRFQNAIGRREFAEKNYAHAIHIKEPRSREEWVKDPKNQVRKENWNWLDKKRSTGAKGSGYEIHGGSLLPKLIRANGRIVKTDEIASDRLTTDWGFKSVQFGNYMDDRTSREHITRFVCALKDLEDVLEMDLSKAIHEGNLSMSFGARGIGKAMAHYESGYRIINLTKKKGDGTFAHEFGHFLDHLSTGKESNRSGSHYVSEDFQGSLGDSAQVLMNAIRKSPSGKDSNYYISSLKIGSQYWSKPRELFARAFESYAEDKMKAKGMKNNYLVAPNTISDPDSLTDDEFRGLAYPQGDDRIRIYNAFDDFFREMKLQKNWEKPFDSDTQRISSVEENLDTVGDIVRQRKKRKTATEDQETLL
ncbi:LPD1 domain-containing protein [Leptospira alexanderi]|uniref:LPD1 domain-containing protein n=1 Tax=Leptospira alexanderi TaxID=100053 RepID=UPI001FD4FB06|nr:LPD1 domain-containing protein [Leptospira alexanderi]